MRVPWSRCRGFSIAETLISVFLLALLLIVLFNLFPTTVLANRQGSQQMQAMDLAQSVLAEARARPFQDLVPGTTETGGPVTMGDTTYTTELVVSPPGTGDPQHLRVLTATINWTANNRPKSLQEKIWVHRIMEE